MKAIVTVIGHDRVGIIADVSRILAERGVNVLDISQTVMQEYFTMIMLVDASGCSVPFAELTALLRTEGEKLGLDIRAQREDIFNAIEYLGRYTHRVAISNNRILSVTETEVTFSARGKKPGDPKREITISHEEFIRRFLMHVLPAGFQKIRYYGFLNNRMKSRNLKIIFRIQGGQRFRQRYAGLSMAELLKAVWNIDLSICPECGCASMQQLGRSYAPFP